MSSSTSHHSTPVTVSGYTEVDNPKSVDIKYMTEAVFVGKGQGRNTGAPTLWDRVFLNRKKGTAEAKVAKYVSTS